MSASIPNNFWKYTPQEIADFVVEHKRSREGERAVFRDRRETTKEIRMSLSGVRVTLPPIEYCAGGNPQERESFHSALLLEKKRVRGIDYSPIEKKRMYKTLIPKGWHENVIDWRIPTSDENHNRHVGLPNFEDKFTDLYGFHRACCQRWNIELEQDDTLL